MTYVLVEWEHEEEDEPYQIYSELDSCRRETRKVEFYKNGLVQGPFPGGSAIHLPGTRGHDRPDGLPRPFLRNLEPGPGAAGRVHGDVLLKNTRPQLPEGRVFLRKKHQ